MRRVSPARAAALVLPYSIALLAPLLPLLVQLADVLPRGIAVGGRGVALPLAGICAAAAVVSAAGLLADAGWRAIVRHPMAPPLAALIATTAAAAFFGVAWRAGTFEIFVLFWNAIAFFALWWTMGRDADRHRFLGVYFVSATLASVFAVGLTLSRHPPAAFAYEHGRAAGTFLAPNEFAGFLLFLIPLGLAQFSAPATLKRLGMVAAIVGAVGLAFSASRAAWLGFAVGMPLLVWRFGGRALAIYAITAAIAFGFGLTELRDIAHDPSENASRIAVWRGAARMVERFALTGIGPMTFNRVYPAFKEPDAAVDEVHAHDLPLNVLIENGILGFAAFVWAIVASILAAKTTKATIQRSDRERVLLCSALAAGFVASSVQNLVDVISTFVFMVWWPMLGLMLALGRKDEARAA